MKQDSAFERINFPFFSADQSRHGAFSGSHLGRAGPCWFRRACSLRGMHSEDSLAVKPRRSRFSVP